jgi:hypothetical protein
VLNALTDWLEGEIFPVRSLSLFFSSQAHKRKLTEEDIPETFAKVRKLLFGTKRRKSERCRLEMQLSGIESKLARARRNVAFNEDSETIVVVEDQINQLRTQRDALTHQLGQVLTNDDINAEVLNVIHKLGDMYRSKGEAFKPLLQEVDRVVIHADARGAGSARRYTFTQGELHFARKSRDQARTFDTQQVEP